MDIKDFVRTLDKNEVYYTIFNDNVFDTAILTNNKLVFKDGSFCNIDDCIYLETISAIYISRNNGSTCRTECIKSNQIYPDPNPMPELVNGTFIRDDRNLVGFVFDNKIIFQNGTLSTDVKLSKKHIVAIYDAYCFNQCVYCNIIWQKNYYLKENNDD